MKVGDDQDELLYVNVARVAKSALVPDQWIVQAFWPDIRRLDYYDTEEEAQVAAQAYTDRVLAHLKRARSLAGRG